MSDKGFIKVERSLRDWQWYGKKNMVALWMELLLTACLLYTSDAADER